MMQGIGLVVIGWALGLLGGPIAEAIRRGRRRREIKRSLKEELAGCRRLMGALAYSTRSQLGEIDHDFLRWQLEIEEDGGEGGMSQEELEALRGLIALSPEVLAGNQRNRVREGGSLNLKTYSLPLLDSSVGELTLISPAVRRRMLAVREQLDLLNQEVPIARSLHERTFDPALETVNRAIVTANLENTYRVVARRSKDIADRIASIL